MPKISVIVPVYNVEPFLDRCISSILKQSFTDFELILIESASTDKSGEICDNYAKTDSRIIVVHEEKRNGVSAARNLGIDWAFRNSNSEWIAFIDSDDWIHENYLEFLLRAAEENNADVSVCGYSDDTNHATNYSNDSFPVEIGTYEELIQRHHFFEFNPVAVWAKLYKKHLLKTIRFPVGRINEDLYFTYLALFNAKRLSLIKMKLYYYFSENQDSLSHLKLSVDNIRNNLDGYEIQMEYFYNHQSKHLFQNAFIPYVCYVHDYSHRSNCDEMCKNELEIRKNRIKLFMRKYRKYLPSAVKKHGYNRLIKNGYIAIADFENDAMQVKKEKGAVYSMLWRLKQKFKGLLA